MTNEKIIKNEEIMSEKELDSISGGYGRQTDEIINAIGKVTRTDLVSQPTYGGDECLLESVTVNRLLNRGEVEDYLKEHYGIDAEISNYTFLWFGDGDPNKYSKDGQPLMHHQVLNIINGK